MMRVNKIEIKCRKCNSEINGEFLTQLVVDSGEIDLMVCCKPCAHNFLSVFEKGLEALEKES